ncbi:MAG: hypothetical protein K0R67_3782 [Paenibacillus sp.]|jgi:hypothetical protein|nr:hypothetical protein [Paenibacillus sp.]
MVYIIGSILFIGLVVALLGKARVNSPYSKGFAVSIGLSLLANVSLAQNYTHSLIPGAHDGIAISNTVAYWIIGGDRWSVQLFRDRFELSCYITLALLVTYVAIQVVEAMRNRKQASLQ